MSRVLIIKTSSLGDVIHNLPILADIHDALPDATIDWVVEEAYADILRMHPYVNRVIPVAQRRWRRSVSSRVAAEKREFESVLQEQAYDYVLDTQGLLKSALLARSARLACGGVRVGFSRRLAREGLARLFYDRGFDVEPHLHAIERVRSLAAQALAYPLKGGPRFCLQAPSMDFDWLGDSPYCVLLHATSRAEKAWPAADWRDLMRHLWRSRLVCVLPYGTELEHKAALELAAGESGVIVAPALSLASLASVIARARGVVGVDTGLTHLSAALDVPTVALFGATPQWRYAPYWTEHAISLGENRQQPPPHDVIAALQRLGVVEGA